MTIPSQLLLPLGHRPAAGREDFLIAPGNAEAVAMLDHWPDWPGPTVVLTGAAGAGKSHLASVFAARVGEAGLRAVLVAGMPDLRVDPPALLADADAVILDGADAGVDETGLFHLFNAVREGQKSLLITCRRPPAEWARLPDLRSRLSSVPAVSLGPPDDAVMAAVLVKLFSDRQLRVGAEVIDYLVSHMERSFAAAQGLVAAVDTLSMAERRPVTIPLVRRVLNLS